MKKRVIKLTESDLQRIVKRVIKENMITELGGMDDGHPRFGNVRFSDLSRDEIMRMGTSEYSEDSDEDLIDDDEGLGISDDMPSYKTKYRYRGEDLDDKGLDSFKRNRFERRR